MRKIFFILLAMLPAAAFAAWHDFVPQTITQPNGKVIECFGSGDEFYHWLHDANGYTIVMNPDDGYFYYGIKKGETVVPSEHIAGSIDPAQAGLGKWVRISEKLYYEKRVQFLGQLKSTNGTPKRGKVNSICVYISFADDSVFKRKRLDYKEIWSADDKASVRDYYRETSYNTLDLVTHHFPLSPDTVNLSYVDIHPRRHYLPKSSTNPDGYGSGETASREHSMLRRAVEYIESQIPDSVDVDMNDDGSVDNISFVIRGNSSAWADLLWPHAWSLFSYSVRLKGARIGSYFLTMENGFGTGTICHELGHVFGAPDLYHYTSTGAPDAVGGWCLMNSSQDPPQGICGFLRYKYNQWISNLPEITETGTYTILPLGNPERNLYKIRSPFSRTEYFLLEFRKREGRYENGLPGTGLLVYRINPGAGNGNAGGPPDEVYLYRPGGSMTDNGSLGSAAHGVSNRNSISDRTDPDAFLWNNGEGGPGGLDITDITNHGDSITFRVNINHLFPPANLTFSPEDTYIDLEWTPSLAQNLSTYYIYRNRERYANTNLSYFRDLEVENGETYKYYVTAYYSGEHSGESTKTNEVIVTPMGIRSLPYEEDFEKIGHGWILKNGVEGFRWGTGDDLGLQSDNTTSYIGANSVAAGINTRVTDHAISPRIDLSGKPKVNLYFDYSLKRWQQVDRLKLLCRPNPSAAWTQIIELPVSGYGVGFKWRKYSVELPSEALAGEMQIGFLYDDKGELGYGSAIDNVIIREPATGVEDQALDNQIMVYPNPASGLAMLKLDIQGNPPVVLRLIDINGKNMLTKSLENSYNRLEKIDLENYPGGVYFLMIEYSDQVIIRQLIKTGE